MQALFFCKACRLICFTTIFTAILYACLPCAQAAPPHKPPIEVRPELYLGWTEDQQQPQPKRLSWPLVITLVASDTNNQVIAGPITLTAYEEIVGARFSMRDLQTTMQEQDPPGTNHAALQTASADAFDVITTTAIVLHELGLAAQITPHGANSIRLRCFVRLHTKKNVRMRTYETLTAVECRPGRRVTLASFPDVFIHLTAEWSKGSPYLLSK